jgi:hypothetical protein
MLFVSPPLPGHLLPITLRCTLVALADVLLGMVNVDLHLLTVKIKAYAILLCWLPVTTSDSGQTFLTSNRLNKSAHETKTFYPTIMARGVYSHWCLCVSKCFQLGHTDRRGAGHWRPNMDLHTPWRPHAQL